MNTAQVLSYAAQHNIHLATNKGKLILEAPDSALTEEFLESAKQHKPELIRVLSDNRWNPELAAEGYQWCLDCQHLDGLNCTHSDNPFRSQQPQVPRKCRWYEDE